MTKRIDPLSAEALAVPLPASFHPSPALDSMTETLADAHRAAPTQPATADGDPIGGIAGTLAAARRRPALWLAAVILSLVFHCAFAFFFIAPPETVQIAGGAPASVPVLGNAFENMQAAGEPAEEPTVTQPVETQAQIQPLAQAEIQQAVEPQQTEPLETEASQPVAAEPAETLPVTDMQPQAPDGIVVSEAPQTAPRETEEAETAETPETIVSESEPIEAVQPETVETPLETAETIEPLPGPVEDIPVPTPRPEYTPPPPPRQTAEQPQPQPAGGARGQQAASQSRGSTDGQADRGGAVEGARQASQAQAQGNAAVSNYPGKVVTRLRRALRYPREARRDRLTGEVHVRFTVAANGSVGGVSVVRSSGSPILDQAALQTVQRAAPFPAIPPAAGRSSWPFTVPLAFVR